MPHRTSPQRGDHCIVYVTPHTFRDRLALTHSCYFTCSKGPDGEFNRSFYNRSPPTTSDPTRFLRLIRTYLRHLGYSPWGGARLYLRRRLREPGHSISWGLARGFLESRLDTSPYVCFSRRLRHSGSANVPNLAPVSSQGTYVVQSIHVTIQFGTLSTRLIGSREIIRHVMVIIASHGLRTSDHLTSATSPHSVPRSPCRRLVRGSRPTYVSPIP